MKFSVKTTGILLAAVMLMTLAACGEAPSSQPASSLPTSTPDDSASRAQSQDGLLSEDEVANHVPTIPLEGAPEFLTREQQQLYLDAFELYSVYFGPSIGSAMYDAEDPNETRVVDGYTYTKAHGDYAKWADFWAALTAVFTEEYAEELISPVDSVPVYENLEGDTWFLAADRGSHMEWVGPDSFLEGDTDADVIEFYVVGHYENQSNSEAYEEDYPLTLMKTADGWRFSQFHITF